MKEGTDDGDVTDTHSAVTPVKQSRQCTGELPTTPPPQLLVPAHPPSERLFSGGG